MEQKNISGSVHIWHDQAGLRWEPTEKGNAIGGQNSYSTVHALERVFGPAPWEFTEESLLQLEAMAATEGRNGYGYFQELVDAIKEHRSIRVWSPLLLNEKVYKERDNIKGL